MTDEQTISLLTKRISALYEKVLSQQETIERLKNCANCTNIDKCIKYLSGVNVCGNWKEV